MMRIMILIMIASLIVIIGLMLRRALAGPTVFDRMNALGVIAADSTLLIVLFGYLDHRPDMYIDIAISYAVLGFVGSVAIAKYFGGKES